MDMMRDAMQELDSVMNEYMTVEAVYVYSDGTRLSVPATLGKTTFRYTNRYNQMLIEETRDYLVSSEYLNIEPGRGDRIEDGDSVYQVAAPNNEPCWRWSDEYRLCRRIHTKFVAEVNDVQ